MDMLVYQISGPSGGKLAFLLNCSVKMPYGNEGYENWSCSKERDGILPMAINYGCDRKHLPETLNQSNCLNYNSEDTGDKVKCFEIFERLGIPYPKLVTDPANFDAPFLGRENKSSQGRGITKFKPKSENWNNYGCDFFVEYIKVAQEFRVHVFKGQVVCEFNKDFSNCDGFIHSKNFGSKLVFGRLNHPARFDIIDASIKALHGCGLDYGAVDIIADANGKWYVLEVNSAPSMAHSIGYLYAEKIAHFLGYKIEKFWTIKDDGKFVDNRRVLENFKYEKNVLQD